MKARNTGLLCCCFYEKDVTLSFIIFIEADG